jgi:hypothetical protein
MSFKDTFVKMPSGPAREEFIYNTLVKQGPPKNLVPVTVDGPNNTKITYEVMPDYLMIDGIRVTIAPATAQRVADAFGMKLPTSKMSQQIYNAANTKVRATPLSNSGYVGVDGQRYSGKDVVQSRISNSDAAIEYSKLTDAEIEKQRKNNPAGLIAGHGKEILQPLGDPKDVSFGGWQGQNGKPLQPYTAAHKGAAASHSEYGLYTRLISNNVKVTLPSGKVINTTMDKLANKPNLWKSISDNNKIVSYNAKPEQNMLPNADKSVIKKIDDFINSIKL